MLTVGDKLPVPQASRPAGHVRAAGGRDDRSRPDQRQVEGALLLAEGLHLRLPDRDRRLWRAEGRLRRPRRRPDRRFDRHRARPLRLAQSDEQLAGADFPWIADNKKELADALGILDRDEGVAFRATFIVDPDNVIQHVTVNGLNVGRNPAETLRVLDALQTDELCPCNWTPGEEVLKPQAA